MALGDEDYARLLELRTRLRRFVHWSEQQAVQAGLTPAQHQLLLAIRGHRDRRGPTISDVADSLRLKHHSVVGLVDRADVAGLVRRVPHGDDQRSVRLRLTPKGAQRLAALSELHLRELDRLATAMPRPARAAATASRASPPTRAPERGERAVRVARVYDEPGRGEGARILVDRLWPRGVSREGAPFDAWRKDVAPSAALRTWYGHDPSRFAEFARRYRRELATGDAAAALDELRAIVKDRGLVLVTATKDPERSSAEVLRRVLDR